MKKPDSRPFVPSKDISASPTKFSHATPLRYSNRPLFVGVRQNMSEYKALFCGRGLEALESGALDSFHREARLDHTKECSEVLIVSQRGQVARSVHPETERATLQQGTRCA
jgi:hypothetical protein